MSRKNWSSEKLFFRLLNNKTQKTYFENISELHRRPNQKVFERAIDLGKSKIDREKIIGIDVLAQLGLDKRYNQKQILDLYFSILSIPQTPKVLFSTLSAIGHNNGELKKQQVVSIEQFKNHNYSDVRFGVVCALMGVEHKLAIDTLIELSSDSHHQVRDWATFSIGSQTEINTPAIIAALQSRLSDTDHNTRFEAISGLAQRKHNSVKSILIDELEIIDDHGSLILESIELFGDKSFIPLIEAQIEKNKKLKSINEKWLVDSMKRLINNTHNSG